MKYPEILAYTAGIIDGEGSVVIIKTKAPDYKLGCNYQLRLSVGNTQEWLCQWLKMQFGGSVSSFQPRNPNWNIGYTWSLRANQVIPFLKSILPYLQLKSRQAQLAMQFQEINPLKKNGNISKEESQRLRKSLYEEMRKLNIKRPRTWAEVDAYRAY